MEEKKMACTPPMGWNSWNTFTWDINEDLIKGIADVLAEQGYKDAGYEYVVIDDCWSLKERDGNGNLVPDPAKFPNGMKAVADYIHGKGLKFGMYSCAGTHTCAGHPGSFEHEFQDAAQFAQWGIDFLKYDYCYKPGNVNGEMLYRRMGLALRNCGRSILFSACNWGADEAHNWIRSAGAHMYRSTGDIQDNWGSIRDLAVSQTKKSAFTGNYCHNDMDMLVVGLRGGSNNDFIGKIGGCTDIEYRTHFSLWCMMGSPLMMGYDVRKGEKEIMEILMNRDVIAINQDAEARGCYVVYPEPGGFQGPDCFVLVKVLTDGDLAIGFFNLTDNRREMSLQFWDLGMSYASGKALSLYDCWEHRIIGEYKERFAPMVDGHDCLILRAKLT